MYGTPTSDEGITRGPAPYLTSDPDGSHATLHQARLYLIAADSAFVQQHAAAGRVPSPEILARLARRMAALMPPRDAK